MGHNGNLINGPAMIVPKLRSPIVLVHGIFGFDAIRMAGWTLANYFHDIPDYLRTAGNVVLQPALSPTRSVAERAAQLKAFLDRPVPTDPVHVTAHGMGGLDARYMISRLGTGRRVLTLTSIGTPHRGTPFADWGVRRFEWLVKSLFLLF